LSDDGCVFTPFVKTSKQREEFTSVCERGVPPFVHPRKTHQKPFKSRGQEREKKGRRKGRERGRKGKIPQRQKVPLRGIFVDDPFVERGGRVPREFHESSFLPRRGQMFPRIFAPSTHVLARGKKKWHDGLRSLFRGCARRRRKVRKRKSFPPLPFLEVCPTFERPLRHRPSCCGRWFHDPPSAPVPCHVSIFPPLSLRVLFWSLCLCCFSVLFPSCLRGGESLFAWARGHVVAKPHGGLEALHAAFSRVFGFAYQRFAPKGETFLVCGVDGCLHKGSWKPAAHAAHLATHKERRAAMRCTM
jgi:hypothetical protein